MRKLSKIATAVVIFCGSASAYAVNDKTSSEVLPRSAQGSTGAIKIVQGQQGNNFQSHVAENSSPHEKLFEIQSKLGMSETFDLSKLGQKKYKGVNGLKFSGEGQTVLTGNIPDGVKLNKVEFEGSNVQSKDNANVKAEAIHISGDNTFNGQVTLEAKTTYLDDNSKIYMGVTREIASNDENLKKKALQRKGKTGNELTFKGDVITGKSVETHLGLKSDGGNSNADSITFGGAVTGNGKTTTIIHPVGGSGKPSTKDLTFISAPNLPDSTFNEVFELGASQIQDIKNEQIKHTVSTDSQENKIVVKAVAKLNKKDSADNVVTQTNSQLKKNLDDTEAKNLDELSEIKSDALAASNSETSPETESTVVVQDEGKPQDPVIEHPEENVVDEVKPQDPIIEHPEENEVDEEELEDLPVIAAAIDQRQARPEAGIYAANMATANTLFATRMHDRIGEPTFPSELNGTDDAVSPGLWLRVMGGHNKTRLMGGEIATRTNTQLVQGGGEILSWSSNGTNGLHLGVMFGAGKSQSHSRADRSGLEAQGGINGYSTGLYGTWHSNDSSREGIYLDGSLSYNWFGNEVALKHGSDRAIEATADTYRSQGFVGSLESGYTWKIFAGETADVFIQPQLQVIWMGVNAKDRLDGQGDKVAMLGKNNVQTRLGSRLLLRGCASQDQGKQRAFQPYVEANWLHNTNPYGVELEHVRYDQEGTKNIGELKLGTEGQINQNLALWGSVGQKVGGKGFHETIGSLGVKINF